MQLLHRDVIEILITIWGLHLYGLVNQRLFADDHTQSISIVFFLVLDCFSAVLVDSSLQLYISAYQGWPFGSF